MIFIHVISQILHWHPQWRLYSRINQYYPSRSSWQRYNRSPLLCSARAKLPALTPTRPVDSWATWGPGLQSPPTCGRGNSTYLLITVPTDGTGGGLNVNNALRSGRYTVNAPWMSKMSGALIIRKLSVPTTRELQTWKRPHMLPVSILLRNSFYHALLSALIQNLLSTHLRCERIPSGGLLRWGGPNGQIPHCPFTHWFQFCLE